MAGIPYIIYGGMRFYERSEVKDALAYLRIFLDPDESVSFKRVINVPARGIGKTTVEKIMGIAAQNGTSFYAAAGSFKRENAKLTTFLDWFEKLRGAMSGLSLVELLQQILETSGYLRSLSEQGSVEAQERLSNLNELVSSIHDFQESRREAGLRDYLDQVALITDLDQGVEGGVLPLMTLHLAKGLEFDVVAIVGLEEGLLPHSRSQDEIEELEEERRLFYVGMTRARERLLLTHAWRRYLNGQEQYSLPSRFLDELPKELVEWEDHAKQWKVDEDEFNQDYRPTTTYRIGIKVKHPDFGVGYIAASEKTSLGEKVTVKFSNGMIKKLIAEYAHLEKI